MKKILFCAFGALFLSGCSSEDSSGVIVDLNAPIRATASLVDVEPSRAIMNVDEAFNASLFRVDATGSSYPASYAGVAALPADVNADGTLTITPAQYYQINGDYTALLGVYPAVGSGGTWNADNGTVAYAIDGTTDIMATAFAGANKESDQPNLVFSHVLTQVHVKVYAQDQTTIGLWGDIESIAIVGRESECVLTLPAPGATGTVTTAFSGTATDLLLTNADGTAAQALAVTALTKETAQSFGYCMFAPTAGEDITLKIVTTVGATNTVKLASSTFEKGKAYEVAIKMLPSEFITDDNVTITDWENGTTTGPIDGDLI